MHPLRPGTRGALLLLRDAALVCALAAAVALIVNHLRSGGLPLVARRPFQLYVPCPEPLGEVRAVRAGDPLLRDRMLVVDARSAEDFARWHRPGAIHLPFDYLAPVTRERVERVASSGAKAVLVYGDGANPDSGQELARELAGKGIRNVRFYLGGAPALRREGGVR